VIETHQQHVPEGAQHIHLLLMFTAFNPWCLSIAHDVQAPEKVEAHWATHGDVASRAQRNGGAHWGFLSALLTQNSPDGPGPIVGQAFSVADTTLFELTHAYLGIFGTEMHETVCPLGCCASFASCLTKL
jgi:hypothetical protein